MISLGVQFLLTMDSSNRDIPYRIPLLTRVVVNIAFQRLMLILFHVMWPKINQLVWSITVVKYHKWYVGYLSYFYYGHYYRSCLLCSTLSVIGSCYIICHIFYTLIICHMFSSVFYCAFNRYKTSVFLMCV